MRYIWHVLFYLAFAINARSTITADRDGDRASEYAKALAEDALNWQDLLAEREAWRAKVASASSMSIYTEPRELQALASFYNSMNGPDWVWKTFNTTKDGPAWNFSASHLAVSDPCRDMWQGLLCTCNTHLQAAHFYGYYYYDDSPAFDASRNASCSILKIVLDHNNIVGNIEDGGVALRQLRNLTHLFLGGNVLTGPVSALCGLSNKLLRITVRFNFLSGKMPDCLPEDYPVLFYLGLNFNAITGPIASNIGYMKSLTALAINFNSFSGTVPDSLVLLSDIMFMFDVNNNGFTGPLPPFSQAAGWKRLVYLNLMENYFTGTIPQSYGYFPLVASIDLHANQLTGTIPSSLGGMSSLTVLALYRNRLRGTLPQSFSGLSLQGLQIQENSFSSTLPSFIYDWPLVQLLVDKNQFTGTIDSSIGKLGSNDKRGKIPPLGQLSFHDNFFSGTLPSQLGELKGLIDLDVSNNFFEGKVPSTLAQLSNLQYLFLSNNFLSSRTVEVNTSSPSSPSFMLDFIDVVQMKDLKYIDISNNVIRGNFPGHVFKLSSLVYFASTSTCFQGQLPNEICDASATLTYLILDGLTSNSACLVKPWHNLAFLNGTYTQNLIASSIPSCLFAMPLMEVLHLSGNGLTGTLPANFSSPLLRDLTLSHNRLKGKVPSSLLLFSQLAVLDLSSNMLKGHIADLRTNATSAQVTEVFSYNTGKFVGYKTVWDPVAISLKVNRFSGPIPHELCNPSLKNVDILQGNLFECPAAAEAHQEAGYYPQNDPFRSEYVCGSSLFNRAMYAFLICCFVAAFFCSTFYWLSLQELPADTTTWKFWLIAFTKANVLKRVHWHHVLIPGVGLGLQRRTESRKEPSGAAPSSGTIRVLDFAKKEMQSRLTHIQMAVTTLYTLRWDTLRLGAVIIVCLLPAYLSLSTTSGSIEDVFLWTSTAGYLSGITPAVVLFFLWLFLIVFVSRLRMFKFSSSQKVAVETYRESVVEEFPAIPMHKRLRLVLRAVIIFGINFVCIMLPNILYVTTTLNQAVEIQTLSAIAVAIYKVWFNVAFIPFLLELEPMRLGLKQADLGTQVNLMNVIFFYNKMLGPLLAVMVTDPNCFSALFRAPPPLSFTTSINVQNKALQNLRSLAVSKTISFSSPFLYNYQCSSALLTNYVPVYMIMYSVMCFLLHFKDFFLRLILPFLFQVEGVKTKKTRYRWIMLKLYPRILFTRRERVTFYDQGKKVFRGNLYFVAQSSNLLILLTFGVAAPLLGVTIILAMWSMTLHQATLIGRHVVHEREEELAVIEANKIAPPSPPATAAIVVTNDESTSSSSNKETNPMSQFEVMGINQLNKDCSLISPTFLADNKFYLLLQMSSFFAFFLIDIAGDAIGVFEALPFAILLAISPFFIYLFELVERHYQQKRETAAMAFAASTPPVSNDVDEEKPSFDEIPSPMHDNNTSKNIELVPVRTRLTA